jgi:hypothetical protein
MMARGAVALLSCVALALTAGGHADLPAIVEVVNARVDTVTYRGVRALHLVPAPETAGKDENMLALLEGPAFTDGTIEVEVAGAPRPDASPDSRGFIGISVRTGEHGAWTEVFYLRPTNGRADDQLRRTTPSSTRPIRSIPGIACAARARAGTSRT